MAGPARESRDSQMVFLLDKSSGVVGVVDYGGKMVIVLYVVN